MKHEDLIFLPFAALVAIVLILAIIAIVKFNRLPYEDKAEIPGILDNSDLSKTDMGIQFCEQPFIDCY